jgi:hypothetical protein
MKFILLFFPPIYDNVYAGNVKQQKALQEKKTEMTQISPRHLFVTQNKPLSWPLSVFGLAARDVIRCATNTKWRTANYSFVGTDNM